MNTSIQSTLGVASALALVATVSVGRAEYATGYGPNPKLPPPHQSLVPTIEVAPATGWPAGVTPKPADGLEAKAFADALDHPRWLHVLPNGDVLVAETNAPERPEQGKGFMNWVKGLFMSRAGAKTKSANRITLLRDADGDGVAEFKTPFLKDLHSPFGMALIGENLYVANTDAVLRFVYKNGDTAIKAPGVKVADLPGGPLNHHWTKNILANRDGTRLYATVGSNSNIAENGIEAEKSRAAILEIDLMTGTSRVFASGLRNANGLALEPTTDALWTVVNERDELGNDLVPDYLTSVKDGAFYGWPYSYFGQHVDPRVEPPRPDLVAKAIVPDYGLGAHTAALGLAFSEGTALPQRYRSGAFIGQHGSWNRNPPAGYKVVFVPFANGKPSGPPEDVLTAFVDDKGNARGRPVGVAIDGKGALLVADDVGNTVWRLAPSAGPSSHRQESG
jgi:glucose/arabinose dehydrogenase